jgi:hypothetical protein
MLVTKIFIDRNGTLSGECVDQQNIRDVTVQPEEMDLDQNSDWLHTNDSC